MENNSHLPPSFFTGTPWQTSPEQICPAVAMILHRNLFPYHFPKSMSDLEAGQTLELIKNATLPLLDNPKTLMGNALDPQDKEFLFEHFILNEAFERFDPHRALIVDTTTNILALVNIEDHLNLHLFTSKMDWADCLTRLKALEKELSHKLNFAFSGRFGYLTGDPKNCGTGLVVQAFLHLPALIHLGNFAELNESMNSCVTLLGLGDRREYIADLVLIENSFKLGVTEEDIVDSVRKAADKCIAAEKEARQKLRSGGSDALKDKVSRAFGLLAHSYSLQIQETLSALSLVHLGKEVGWVKGGDDLLFHDLFFHCRRGHLQHTLQEKNISKEALLQQRARLLQKKLLHSQLLI